MKKKSVDVPVSAWDQALTALQTVRAKAHFPHEYSAAIREACREMQEQIRRMLEYPPIAANAEVKVEDINSAGIESVCRESGITEIECIGKFEHPDHHGSNDWSITLYKLDSGSGGRVADTNGDPGWEDADEAAFAEMLAEYGIHE